MITVIVDNRLFQSIEYITEYIRFQIAKIMPSSNNIVAQTIIQTLLNSIRIRHYLNVSEEELKKSGTVVLFVSDELSTVLIEKYRPDIVITPFPEVYNSIMKLKNSKLIPESVKVMLVKIDSILRRG